MQYRETPLQEKTSFILPPHFLHFMFLVYPEKGSNGNTRQLRNNFLWNDKAFQIPLF
jgi:hypothetical protein